MELVGLFHGVCNFLENGLENKRNVCLCEIISKYTEDWESSKGCEYPLHRQDRRCPEHETQRPVLLLFRDMHVALVIRSLAGGTVASTRGRQGREKSCCVFCVELTRAGGAAWKH